MRYPTWGGKREGAGRPRVHERRTLPHGRRETFRTCYPLFVTIGALDHVPNLRGAFCLPIVEEAIASWKSRDRFRVVHYSVQSNHVHLIVEAPGGRAAVSRAMKGIKVSIARQINQLTFSSGTFWADRYHDEVLDSPRKVRNRVAYVLGNGRRHRVRAAWRRDDRGVDPCSSAEAFDGWKTPITRRRRGPPPVAPPGTWLLRSGWKRAGGRIAPSYVPVAGR